jgi:AcrR family transcriptional regulator
MSQSSVPTKGVRRRSTTRELLLDAARVVLARDGIQGASVEQICEHAGFTRGAFYSSFSTKDDLVLALFNREHETVLSMLHAAADLSVVDTADPLDAIRIIVDRFFALYPPEREWFLLEHEFMLRVVRDDDLGRSFAVILGQIRQDFNDFVDSVLQRLGLRLSIPTAHASTILIGTYEIALREAFTENRGIDETLIHSTLPHLLYGVALPLDAPR